MSIQEPENVQSDRPIEDSGIHIHDAETAPASAWQIAMVAALIVAILCVFFYGLNNQRQEEAGASAPAQQVANVPPQKPATTGQGQAPDAKNPPGAARQQTPQKDGGQNAAQPAPAPQKSQ